MKAAADLFKIFCVDKRIEIIEHLKTGSMNVNSLADALKISPSAVSQHLRILKSSGLVTAQRKGYFIHLIVCRNFSMVWMRSPLSRGRRLRDKVSSLLNLTISRLSLRPR